MFCIWAQSTPNPSRKHIVWILEPLLFIGFLISVIYLNVTVCLYIWMILGLGNYVDDGFCELYNHIVNEAEVHKNFTNSRFLNVLSFRNKLNWK